MLNLVIGNNIKLYRESRGLTRREAARLAGLTPAYWGYLERGLKKPSLDVIKNVSKVLGIKPYLLLVDSMDELPGELIHLLKFIKQMGDKHVEFFITVIHAYIETQER